MAAWSWRFLLVSAALAVAAFMLIRLRVVVLPVILALLLTSLLEPPARWLKERRWPALAATWAVLLGALLVLGGVGAVLVPQFLGSLDQLGETVRTAGDQIRSWLIEGPLSLSGAQIERYLALVSEGFRTNARSIVVGVLSGAALAVEVLAGVLLTLPILFFFVKDGEQISGWFLRQVDEQYRDDVRALSRRAWQTVAAYLRGLAVVAFFDAVVIGIGLLVIGVPLVVPLVTLTFFGGFFPIVGAVLAGLLAVLVALVNGGLVDALAVLAVVLVVQQVEGDVLAPLVLGRAVQLHPLVILLALTAGAVVAGVVGAFLAVPTAAVLVAVGAEFRARREGAEAQPDGLRRKEASWRR